jgi:hypothetical protein
MTREVLGWAINIKGARTRFFVPMIEIGSFLCGLINRRIMVHLPGHINVAETYD